MKILGFIPTSFSDWDGKLVSILFLGGCNYRCPFCQNYPLLQEEDPERVVNWTEVARHLKNKQPWIDGVVVSGGEPLLHPEVFDLCARIKELGFAVKLDTNGSFPFALMELAQRGWLTTSRWISRPRSTSATTRPAGRSRGRAGEPDD